MPAALVPGGRGRGARRTTGGLFIGEAFSGAVVDVFERERVRERCRETNRQSDRQR